jgi:hypothetical protein
MTEDLKKNAASENEAKKLDETKPNAKDGSHILDDTDLDKIAGGAQFPVNEKHDPFQ